MIRIINFPKETGTLNQNVMYFSDFTRGNVYATAAGVLNYTLKSSQRGGFPRMLKRQTGQNEPASKAVCNLLCIVATWTKVMGKQLQK